MSNQPLLQAALLAIPRPVAVFDHKLDVVLISNEGARVLLGDRSVKVGTAMEDLEEGMSRLPWSALAHRLREVHQSRDQAENSRKPMAQPEDLARSVAIRGDLIARPVLDDALATATALRATPIFADAPAPRSVRTRGVRSKTPPPATMPSLLGWIVEVEFAPRREAQLSTSMTAQPTLILGGQSDAAGVECFFGMWTRDAALKRTFRVLERVAAQPVPVLVRGETGTGKELAAQALHQLSPRREGPFRAINCAAVPANLIESELFGHVRGAFTGAIKDTPGHFQLANGGTLFLDEIAELPLELQAKLLRVVETQTVLPIGARQPQPIDVRIISATHRSLRSEVEAGRFRADLMYRLRVIPVFLPPLRERTHDIELLTQQFIDRLNQSGARKISRIVPSALEVLLRYDYPGNVRELKNILQYAYVIGVGDELSIEDLPPELMAPVEEISFIGHHGTHRPGRNFAAVLPHESTPVIPFDPNASPALQIAAIERALASVSGKRSAAAEALGMSRITLWRKMRALGMTADDA